MEHIQKGIEKCRHGGKKPCIFFFLINYESISVHFAAMTITREGKVELTPAYDILSTSIVLSEPQEEIALPIKGEKRKLDVEILVHYFGRTRMGLNQKIISSLDDLKGAAPEWDRLIGVSFLPDEMKQKYRLLLTSRRERLFG